MGKTVEELREQIRNDPLWNAQPRPKKIDWFAVFVLGALPAFVICCALFGRAGAILAGAIICGIAGRVALGIENPFVY